MLTFLFWNMGGEGKKETAEPRIHEKSRETLLCQITANLADLHAVDVVMLAECPMASQTMLFELNRKNTAGNAGKFREHDPRSLCEKILIFPRFSMKFLLLRSEGLRFTGRIIRLPKPRLEIILFVAHLGSKMNMSDASQTLAMPGLSTTIRELERKAEHRRTVVVGDLNMNPFDDGLVGAEGLNAVMTRRVALKEERKVDKVVYPFFYNPMWSHFGDSTHEIHPPGSQDHEPPGTCYYRAAESRWHYWNILDQVLIRPELLDYFKNKDLKILVGDGTTSLINEDGIPDRDAISDHLPILFRLDI